MRALGKLAVVTAAVHGDDKQQQPPRPGTGEPPPPPGEQQTPPLPLPLLQLLHRARGRLAAAAAHKRASSRSVRKKTTVSKSTPHEFYKYICIIFVSM